MATKTDIANLAIASHSGDFVDDIDAAPGGMPDAIRAVWATALETALAEHPWKFARTSWKNQGRLPDNENTDPDRKYAYRQPPDCVRVFELRPQVDFEQWEGLITTDQGETVTMIGTRRGVDVGRFSAFFVEYLAAILAWRICIPITASEAVRKRCGDDMEKARQKAISDNARAGTVRTIERRSSFLDARVSGGRDWRG